MSEENDEKLDDDWTFTPTHPGLVEIHVHGTKTMDHGRVDRWFTTATEKRNAGGVREFFSGEDAHETCLLALVSALVDLERRNFVAPFQTVNSDALRQAVHTATLARENPKKGATLQLLVARIHGTKDEE